MIPKSAKAVRFRFQSEDFSVSITSVSFLLHFLDKQKVEKKLV